MQKAATKDLTNGSPMKLILGFAVPMLMGMLFQQFYNVVDTMIVGKFLGKYALAGVGSTGSINFMIIGFCMGVSAGFSIPIAQTFGARDFNGLKRYLGNAIVLCSILAVIMTFLSTIFCKKILILMNTPDEVMEHAYGYIVVIFIGIPVIYMYNLLSGVLRAVGDSKHPVMFLVIASFINIGLDLLFIIVFGLGVTGAALATVLSQLISGIMCLVFIVKSVDILHITKRDLTLERHHVFKLFNMGIPMGLQYSITAIGSVLLQVAVNSQGADIVAAVTTAGKVGMFFCCPFDALGSTMSTYGGQNVGAGKIDRLSKGMWAAGILGCIYSVIAFGVLYFFGRYFAMLFMSAGESAVLDYAHTYLIWNSLFYIPLVFVNVVRFLIQGMGFSMLAILAGVCEMIARAAASLFLVPVIGYTGICLASPLAWILADVFLFPAFYYTRNILRGKISNG
ncbi:MULTISPECIES: MATE family efflux transporter [unclassified Butyrivibrio]|uniref:MATE family efflux transporter n=1 Tax=unclassified Butyrivibrio TaxID=2639466 RepID=UPI000427E7D2|nr:MULTISPECIES: MATE family efflux transporter [unclassified Butyrivibrio]SDB41279.1 putative efflux protein, MATE family [Butyrivibrio sp. INlla16]